MPAAEGVFGEEGVNALGVGRTRLDHDDRVFVGGKEDRVDTVERKCVSFPRILADARNEIGGRFIVLFPDAIRVVLFGTRRHEDECPGIDVSRRTAPLRASRLCSFRTVDRRPPDNARRGAGHRSREESAAIQADRTVGVDDRDRDLGIDLTQIVTGAIARTGDELAGTERASVTVRGRHRRAAVDVETGASVR
ncbi:MAG: hypothetical protein AAF532_14235 [Planctomycetota bacterium]